MLKEIAGIVPSVLVCILLVLGMVDGDLLIHTVLWRFTLRTLLIATTLVAVVLGIIAAAT